MSVGIITGSGGDSLDGLELGRSEEVATRFGLARLNFGRVAGVDVVQISRHGDGHARLSNHINHRANVVALREANVDCVVGLTACGAVDPEIELGSLVLFDDLYFPDNRLSDGTLCSLHDQPGAPGRGHWIFDNPFSESLRAALLHALTDIGIAVRDGGTYGHVDGPRFNSRSEVRALAACGVAAISQTGGPETVLCGEAGLPYALVGYPTDYANGVPPEPTPLPELMALVERSAGIFAAALSAALPAVASARIEAAGSHVSWD
ncbi:MAG TPA: MTAP family purine nucleoside phosphorylase [Solirubrobacteraceae bacterium]|nr:MTAP family purine nucleoside phosphorylase [Solirubrobacteraceae bacterium]